MKLVRWGAKGAEKPGVVDGAGHVRDLSHHWQAIDRYTTLAARQMFEDGRRAGWWDLAVHPPAAFLRNYLLRLGILDGTSGLIISLVNAYSVFLKFAKLWELGRRR